MPEVEETFEEVWGSGAAEDGKKFASAEKRYIAGRVEAIFREIVSTYLIY